MTDTPNSIRDILTANKLDKTTFDQAEQAINAYILGEVMELLNGDEKVLGIDNYKDIDDFMLNENMKAVRNQLRQELRNKANKKFGGGK